MSSNVAKDKVAPTLLN